ncbi:MULTISPECIES: YslB family protein [Listeria]|uniref:YslB family protein n=1 Tax=Listeria TaxID=1637 RepID=UPI000B592C3A|nr:MULTISPECIES: YslB family protein [Listeria]
MTEEIHEDVQSQIPSFGLELLRDHLIPELLGEETPHILYWAGKDLARKFPLASLDEISAFFKKASFGELTLTKEKKDELRITLSGEQVEKRFLAEGNPTFKLEAGFLAEQIQSQRGFYAEAYDEINARKKEALLIVKWDRKETTDNEENY